MHQEGDRPGKFRARREAEHAAHRLDGLYLFLLFNIGCKLKPRARKFKYVITYNDGPRDTELKLGNYYVGPDEPDEKHVHDESDAGL